MLISVSGMVGSGKTTIANWLVRLANDRGLPATYVRFQSLPCFSILRSPLRPRQSHEDNPSSRTGSSESQRWTGYRRKRLTATRTLVYLTRILAFQVYRLCWSSDRLYVLNRYFYDLFAHYQLNTSTERFYYSVVRRLMPVPDLAILALAMPETIARRRSNYSSEYLSEVRRAYDEMQRGFPELVEIRTDPGESTFEKLEMIVTTRIVPSSS